MAEANGAISLLEERARRMADRIKQEGWEADVDHQSEVVGFLRNYWRVLPDTWKEGLTSLAVSRLGCPRERFLGIVQLDDLRKRRRALRALRWQVRRRASDDHVYPTTGWLGGYLEYASESEVPFGWHFWVACSILGAACRRNIYMDRNRYFLYPNTYMILVGATATHKSTAIGTGADLLGQANGLLETQALQASEDRRVVLLPEKITPESMIDALQVGNQTINVDPFDDEHGKVIVRRTDSVGFLMADELANLIGRDVKGADRMVVLLTNLYGCKDDYVAQTLTYGQKALKYTALSFLAGSTMSWINNAITAHIIQGGFTGRCLFLGRNPPETPYAIMPPIDPVASQALAQMLTPWMKAPLLEAELTPDALKWFIEWYESEFHKPLLDPNLEGYKNRRQDHLLKLAMILTVSELSHPDLSVEELRDEKRSLRVGEAQLLKAWEILSLEEARMPQLFQRMGQHAEADGIDYALAKIKEGAVTFGGAVPHSWVVQKCRYRLGSADRIKRILETLVESRDVERHESAAPGGRRGLFYRVP